MDDLTLLVGAQLTSGLTYDQIMLLVRAREEKRLVWRKSGRPLFHTTAPLAYDSGWYVLGIMTGGILSARFASSALQAAELVSFAQSEEACTGNSWSAKYVNGPTHRCARCRALMRMEAVGICDFCMEGT